jgi:hypothetical protein
MPSEPDARTLMPNTLGRARRLEGVGACSNGLAYSTAVATHTSMRCCAPRMVAGRRAFVVGPTDVAWEGWSQQYHAPKAIFP